MNHIVSEVAQIAIIWNFIFKLSIFSYLLKFKKKKN